MNNSILSLEYIETLVKHTEEYVQKGQELLNSLNLIDDDKYECVIHYEDAEQSLPCFVDHTVCKHCYDQINICPMCRAPIGKPEPQPQPNLNDWYHRTLSLYDGLQLIEIGAQFNDPTVYTYNESLQLINEFIEDLPRRHHLAQPHILRHQMKMINIILKRHNFYILDELDRSRRIYKYQGTCYESYLDAYDHITTNINEKRMLKTQLSKLAMKIRHCLARVDVPVVL